MNSPTKIGIIGCGTISKAYFNGSKRFNNIEIKACADLNEAAAKAKAEEFGVLALSIEALLADPEIEIVVNLTIPQAHAPVNEQILKAGKHAHCEKPFATNREDGKRILALAKEKGLMVGSAPDTFLGAGFQTSRKVIDDGSIGKPIAGLAFMLSPGIESWHPSPAFYYLKGGGPLLDMGPYYLSALVHLLGPIKKVSAICSRARDVRIATSEPLMGQELKVEVNTHTSGTLEFENGAIITMVMSFDVQKSDHRFIEIHGTEGSVSLPDPNTFAGEVRLCKAGQKEWENIPYTHGYAEPARIMGVADMAAALKSNRLNRTSGELAYHVLDVMLAFDESSESGKHIEIESTCTQPAAYPLGLEPGYLELQ